jgi:hypothetical protein
VLDKLKALMTKAPILATPTDREPLLLYIVATTQVVNTALVMEQEEEERHALKVQHPIYFVTEILADARTLYPHVQKLLYAILIPKRRLRHYFESHPVMVVMSFPLGEDIRNPDTTGRT